MPLITDVTTRIIAKYTTTKDLGNIPTSNLDFSQKVQLTSGTAAGQADKLWYDERTLTASSTEDLDLNGTQTDDFGVTFSIARIKTLFIKAAAANTNNVVVGASATNQWAALLGTTGTITLRPGAHFMMCAGVADSTGYVCAAGSTDLLKVANSAGVSSVTYEIVVVACSV